MTDSTGTLRLQTLAHAYRQSAALTAAIKLDLFTIIDQGEREISQIAQKTGIGLQDAQRLAAFCTASGLVECRDGLYYNASDVERHLVKGRKSYVGPWLSSGKEQFDLWADVAPVLTGEKPLVDKGNYVEVWNDVEAARRFNRATYSIGSASGYSLAHRFDFSNYSLLLDLGGGSGCYSIAITSTFPNMKAIVIDYPTVCTSAGEIIAEHGLSERITTCPGDLLEVDFPPDADVALMSSNIPDFSTTGLATVFRKAFDAMKKNGVMIILGEALYDDYSGPLEPALWYLEQSLVGGWGDNHTISEVCQLLREAGFVDCEISEFAPGILTKFIAHKAN